MFGTGVLSHIVHSGSKMVDLLLIQIVHLQDFAPDIVSWMSFAAFINAWNLCSTEPVIPETDWSSPNSWKIVDNLFKTCIEEQLTDASQMLTSLGNNIPLLARMVTEPISWHLLVIQSCMRAMTPQGKKKKKGGPEEARAV